MNKPKKDSGNKDPQIAPVQESKKRKHHGANLTSHSQSDGGSRQGNMGHEHSGETGRGDRQV